MRKLWKRFKKSIQSLCLVDRFLMLFMLVLFGYLVVKVFFGAGGSQDNDTIGVIVRTSLASIFGYFISSNFAAGASSSQMTDARGVHLPSETLNPSPSARLRNQIGFETSVLQSSGEVSSAKESPAPVKRCGKAQVYVVASIGLCSLVILLATTKLQDAASEIAAMKSQLRDFVSACIGFLVSCGKHTAE